ncbi:MAG: hypothetical protein J7L89_06955 [Bacteroidales bacterium]|nr:hypothetical protein [Bacteroidales bacterium]
MKRLIIITTLLSILSGGYILTRAEGGDNQTTYSTLTGWQQYFCRKERMHVDKVHVTLNLNATIDKRVGLTLGFDSDVVRISCCKNCEKKYSWCNFDLEDKAC